MKPVANPNEPTVANFVQKAYEIINVPTINHFRETNITKL